MSNETIPPGVTVFCDPTLAPAITGLNGASSIPFSVLSAPAALMLAQITRHTRNDVLFTLATAMDQAAAAKLVKPASRIDGFSNRLVLAGRAAAPPTPPPDLQKYLAGATIAVTDATPASGLDGRAVLAANGLAPAAILGAANTADAAFLVTTGAADYGLIYRTDALADPRLNILAVLTADPALTAYAAAVNANAVSPNAQAFVSFLAAAAGRLRAAGLEMAA